ncbi:MAG: glycerol-3-phosphate dehydrogenase/oxidase [Actinobacteria bacterium]|nr:glycerol-3-phosphate dehydrogenase/oxidase [Actinomycetota bacterium]
MRDPAGRWDVLVIGGGITGAGILREAARRGLRAALIEGNDFASGTSSRSSKMVHGGLRYMAQGAFTMTRKAVKERERLLREAPELVTRMPVAFTLRKGKFPGRRVFGALIGVYDRMAGINDHRFLSNRELSDRNPGVDTSQLAGAYFYTDALTDDARLVLCVLEAAVADGATAVNYARAIEPLRSDGRVTGVSVAADGETFEVAANVVVNATGAWADELRAGIAGERRMRPLRGSHLIVPHERLPVSDAVTFFHPDDGRPVYAYEWLGVTVIGTTDLDFEGDLSGEPAITEGEVEYLLAAAANQFGSAAIGRDDVISTMSGVRPVVDSGKDKDPSKETREEAIWVDEGLVTVTGGKLTTFRPIAMATLKAVEPLLGLEAPLPLDERPVFDTPPSRERADRAQPIDGTPYSWADLRAAVDSEQVEHLDDLLLRRTRIGNLLPGGGDAIATEALQLCRQRLGWGDERVAAERSRYERIVLDHYSLPQ